MFATVLQAELFVAGLSLLHTVITVYCLYQSYFSKNAEFSEASFLHYLSHERWKDH